jgi:MoxR-like ATPase
VKTVPAGAVQASNPLVPRTFDEDYRGGGPFADEALVLPNATDREAAFKNIEARLAVGRDTLDEIFVSVADGKHILLYGPPGTGKTSLGEILAAEVFNSDHVSETATADWTSFETVGGLQLVAENGREELQPRAGVITSAVVACLNSIAANKSDDTKPQATWLVLDELNRANMDAAFGPLFTALDPAHRRVSLPFFDANRQELLVPKRFRIIGTMNSYDKNFLFRLSYALMRRFALIPIDPPATGPDAIAAAGRNREQEKLYENLAACLNAHGAGVAASSLPATHESWLMEPLYGRLIQAIRAPEGLNRGIGFAQVASAARYAALVHHLGLVPDDDDGKRAALDRGVRSAVVPQLEGLPNNAVQQFVKWWGEQSAPVGSLDLSIEATRLLMRGTNLFTSA